MSANSGESNETLLVQPKRKKNYFFPEVYPFPIVRDTTKENAPWNCIIGHIKEQCVEVTDEESMRLLFTMGFFGKGTLSRSTPQALEKRLREEHKNKLRKDKNNAEHDEKENDHSDDEAVRCDESVAVKEENPAKRRRKDEIEVVLSDSDSSDSVEETNTASDQKADGKEALQLSFEEAYFLSYGFGVLVVKDKDQPLDLMQLWHKFCELHPNQNFPVMYTAYHHFRSKGWIVRSGIKYGADFALYKDGPPFYHSSYAVLVKPVKEQNLRDVTIGGRPNLTWSSLSGLVRMCSHVSKALIILYVIKPGTISENKISTPYCVSQYKLEEVLVNRWVPSANRSEDVNKC